MNGADAEAAAADFLRRKGLKLLHRNYRCRGGELDLVMQDRDTVVVVEVRARSRADFGSAAETIGARKQARLVHAAGMLLAREPALADKPLRFDVVALDATGDIEWLRAAFDASE